MEENSSKKTDSKARSWGNEHLVAIVIVLISLLAALSLFTIWYKNRPTYIQTASNSTFPETSGSAKITTSAPTGRRSFVGIIKEIGDNRLAVRVLQNVNGSRREQTILVNIRQNTEILKAGKQPTSLTNAERTFTTATFADLKVGSSINVHSTDVIDGKMSIVAERIDILTY